MSLDCNGFCIPSKGNLQVDAPRPSERRTEPLVAPYEVWIKTDALGWMRSAARETKEGAEQVRDVLAQSFDEVEIRS